MREVLLEGFIYCAGDVVIDVTKFMDARYANGRLEVISTYYRYHAWRPRRGGAALIRYDQGDGDTTQPHYHRFSRDGTLSAMTNFRWTVCLGSMPSFVRRSI